MDQYEITHGTLLILSSFDGSLIIEKEEKKENKLCPSKIIDFNCRIYGSSLSGRKEGTKALIGIKYKPPVIISEINNIIFFPTGSVRDEFCNWVSLNNLKKYLKKGNKTLLIFDNDVQYELDISFYIIENQIFKATMLESKLNKLKIRQL